MFTGLGKKNATLDTGCPPVGRTRPVASWRLHGTSIRRSRERVIWLRGFTLLEITLAVAILAMMSLAIFRFVQSNLTALRVSADASAADAQYGGLRDLLAAEWQSLTPIRGNMTRHAPGDFIVWLRLQPENEKSGRLDLGLLRKPQNDSDIGEGHETWVPLIKNVSSLQIRYFDPQLNVWVDRWSNAFKLPRLVKLTVGRPGAAVPWEAIIPLGRTPWP